MLMKQEKRPPALQKKLLEPFEIEYRPRFQAEKPYRQTKWRWLALILMNLLALGDFMTLEAPQPIETQIKANLGLNEKEYSLLYSSWAFTSIFSPFFGGYLIDRLGVRPTLILFSIVVSIGQLIYTYGGYNLEFGLMIFGRAVHALGADSLNVAQIVITNKWFQGKEIGLAMSISGFSYGVGRALNSFLLPMLYETTYDIGTPMMFGSILCLVGFVLAIIMAKWDEKNDQREIANDPHYLTKVGGADQISLKDAKYFKFIVWLVIINFGTINGYSFSFNAFTNDFYHETYEFTNVEAGVIISSNFIFAAISSTLFGKWIDSHGKRATMIMYSSFMGVIAFLYFFLFSSCFKCISTIIPQILFGLQIGVSLTALLASLPLVLEEKYLGTGFGLCFVLENVIVLVLPPIAGHIKDITASEENDGYFGLVFFFFVSCCFVSLGTIKLVFESNKHNKVLDKVLDNPNNETKVEDDGDFYN